MGVWSRVLYNTTILIIKKINKMENKMDNKIEFSLQFGGFYHSVHSDILDNEFKTIANKHNVNILIY